MTQSPDTPRGLEELAGRVERATGPDRELDVMIAQAIGFSVNGLTVDKLLSYSPHNTIAEIAIWASGDPTPFFVPRYTGSLDDAMILAMPSWWFRANAPLSPEAYGYSREAERRPSAGFEMLGPPYSAGARAATIPLAICAAALRARSHIQGNG